MVIFDQIRVSDDGKKLYLDYHVNSASMFGNIYLDNITIMTGDKVSETTPDVSTGEYIYKKVYDTNVKTDSLVLSKSDFEDAAVNTSGTGPTATVAFTGDISNTLFFVYVKCKAVGENECFPCDSEHVWTTVGVTFDDKLLYQRVMNLTKSFAEGCEFPDGLADLILLWNAFKAAIETDHYIPAIKYFNMLFGIADARESRDGSHSPYGYSAPGSSGRGCGCHG